MARPRRAARRERDAALDAGRVAHHERVARRDLDDVPLEVVGAAAAQARLLVRAPEPPLVAARLGLGGAARRRERGVAQRRQRALVELGQALAQQRDAHALPRRRVSDVAHGRAAGRAVGRRREAHDDLAVQQPRLDEVLGLERERLRRRRRRRAGRRVAARRREGHAAAADAREAHADDRHVGVRRVLGAAVHEASQVRPVAHVLDERAPRRPR